MNTLLYKLVIKPYNIIIVNILSLTALVTGLLEVFRCVLKGNVRFLEERIYIGIYINNDMVVACLLVGFNEYVSSEELDI